MSGGVRVDGARDPEVDELRLALAVDEYIARLDVAMDHAALVSVLHGVGEARDELQTHAARRIVRLDPVVQRRPVHALHREKSDIRSVHVERAGRVDPRDPRMLQPSEQRSLALEARGRGRARHVRSDHLERDAPLGMLLDRFVDDAHPAGAEQTLDAVGTERLRHGLAERGGRRNARSGAPRSRRPRARPTERRSEGLVEDAVEGARSVARSGVRHASILVSRTCGAHCTQ